MNVHRGQVWWTEIPRVGERPTLVVSADTLNRSLSEVTLARVTALERDRGLPTFVALDPNDVPELPERSYVLCHNVYTLPKEQLRRHAGALSPSRLVEVEDALRFALDLG